MHLCHHFLVAQNITTCICRKNQSKKMQPGRKTGAAESSATTPKRQKLAMPQATSSSPGPVTRRQLALSLSGEGPSQLLATPSRVTKSPAKTTAKKKLTPRKGKK